VSHFGERNLVDISVVDMTTGNATRLTFGASARRANWAGDGYVVFEIGIPPQPVTIGLVPAEGGGRVRQLVADAAGPVISPDRRWLFFERFTPGSGFRILGQPIDPDTLTTAAAVQPILVTGSSARLPTIHPSGRWLLFRGTENRQTEVYLTRIPEAQGKWQISRGGGDDPRWSAGGDAVLYTQLDRLVEVPVTLDPAVAIGAPRAVLDARAMRPFLGGYDVGRDGRSFLMVQRVQAPDVPTGMVSVVLNWAEQFRAR
jgi:hypothetical protein